MAQSPCCNAGLFYIGQKFSYVYLYECMGCLAEVTLTSAQSFSAFSPQVAHFDLPQLKLLESIVAKELAIMQQRQLTGLPIASQAASPTPIWAANSPFGGGGVFQAADIQLKPVKTKCVLCFTPVELPYEKAELALKESFHMPCCGGGLRDGGQLIEKQRARLKGEMAR